MVATLSVAVSTLVTAVIIALFVLILAVSNLRDAIMANDWIMPAFTCVVYALFGSLGGKYIVKNIKLAALPLACIVVLSIILGFLKVNVGSAYLFVGIALSALFAGLQIVRQKKKQKAQQETDRLSQIANEEITINPQDSESENENCQSAESIPDESEKQLEEEIAIETSEDVDSVD